MLEKKKVFCKRKKDGKIFKIIVYDIGQDEDLDSVEAVSKQLYVCNKKYK